MSDNPRYATLRDYLRVLRDQAFVIALIAIVAAAVAYVYSSRQPKVYSASADIGIQDVSQQLALLPGGSVSPNVPAEQTPQGRAATIHEPKVAREVKRELGDRVSARQIEAAVGSAVDPSSYLVKVTAIWSSGRFATRLANAFAKAAAKDINRRGRAQFTETLGNLRRRVNRLGESPADQAQRFALIEQISRIEFLSGSSQFADVVKRAQEPGALASPRTRRSTMLGLLLGLALGFFVAFLRDSLDRRLRGGREIQEQLSLPLLGHVRNDAMGQVVRSVNGHAGEFAEDQEAFSILRRNLEFLSVDSPLRSILVTSPLAGEGKSTVAASLACASVIAGKQTLLVECDLRRSSLAQRLGLAASPGLTDYLARRAEPAEILQTVELAPSQNGRNGPLPLDRQSTLVCIMAGTPSPQPAEMLGSERLREFLEAVTSTYEVVVLDSSPLLSVADTRELLPQVDGVLVCIRSLQTTREQALAAKTALQHYPERPTGIVVTGLGHRDAEQYGYYAAYS